MRAGQSRAPPRKTPGALCVEVKVSVVKQGRQARWIDSEYLGHLALALQSNNVAAGIVVSSVGITMLPDAAWETGHSGLSWCPEDGRFAKAIRCSLVSTHSLLGGQREERVSILGARHGPMVILGSR